MCPVLSEIVKRTLYQQEAQLSPRDRAMRRVSWNLANWHATMQKLLVQQQQQQQQQLVQVHLYKSWTNRSYEVGGLQWTTIR